MANQTSSLGDPYMFTGREYDAETGLYYYRARYYNPSIGRFMQTDPSGYDDGINWYLYCGNNPSNWIDPWGNSTVRIYSGKDKITLNDPTMEQFRAAIEAQKERSIDRFEIAGHGLREVMMIAKGRNPYDGSILWTPDMDKVLMSDNYESFADVIRSKLASDAVIELSGCRTASEGILGFTTMGGENIAKQLSRELPNTTVIGNRQYSIGNEPFGFRIGEEMHTFGLKRSYHGGK